MRYLVCYLILINVIAFITYGIDKSKAKRHKWRIPESTLILLALIGGSIGAVTGMHVFHHKTHKPKFKYGVPAIIVLHIIAAIVLFHLKID